MNHFRFALRNRVFNVVGLGLISLLCGANRAEAAERVYGSLGIFERSISVQALEQYAKAGQVTPELATYLRYFKPAQRQKLRRGLLKPATIGPVEISQFFYSSIGEQLLKRAATIVRPKSGAGGFYALRSALILAAADPEGLTFLNVLKHYPTQGIQVDVNEGLNTFSQLQTFIQETDQAVAAIEAQTPAVPEQALADLALSEPGPNAWQVHSFELDDRTPVRLQASGRPRRIPVDVYLPQAGETAHPVIVISHGLNSNRFSYAYLAAHLASHGFGVIVPEHIGSNTEQLLALLEGRADKVTQPTEFLDRPLDIKFLLDALEQRSQTDPKFQARLDWQRVGIIGQSFGGYTALALAGAPLNFEQLRQDCDRTLNTTLNLSLLLQCQALKLSPKAYPLADPRIKGVIAINPIASSLFGPGSLSQIQKPVMILSGSNDSIAPALPEQIRPFTWLTTPNKYFALLKGGTHFSTLDIEPNADPVPALSNLSGPAPQLARGYTQALSTAFMQTYLTDQPNSSPDLTSNLASALSQPPLSLHLTNTIPQ